MEFIISLRKFWRLVHDEENNFLVSDQKPTKESYKTLTQNHQKSRGGD